MCFSLTQCLVCPHHFMCSVSENSGTIPATGGSAMKAVEVIMEHGVPEDRIIFINLVRSFSWPWEIAISNFGEGLVASGFENIRNALSVLKSRTSLVSRLPCVDVLTNEMSRSLAGSMRVSTTERTSCQGSETLASGGTSTIGTVQKVTRTDILTYL